MIVKAKDCEELFRVAVREAASSPCGVTPAACTPKVAEDEAAGTITEVCVARLGLAEERETVTPAEGAGADKVTVHRVPAPALSWVEVQESELMPIDPTRLIVVLWEEPFNEAVTVAFWLLVTLVAVAAKFAVVEFADTVTVAGTVSAESLLATATTLPPVGAG